MSIGLYVATKSAFYDLCRSCRKFGDRFDPPLTADDLVSYETAEKYLTERFDVVLSQLFQSIIGQLSDLDKSDPGDGAMIKVSIPKYISPTASSEDMNAPVPSFVDAYQKMRATVGNLGRLLVIHLDDCQEFFCGLTKTPKLSVDTIKVGNLMCYALRLFSCRVSSLDTCREILWVFSGMRPNLYIEMKVASRFGEPYDVTFTLKDYTRDDVATVLSSYFRFGQVDEVLGEKFKNLCGHPKILYWFIFVSQRYHFESVADFIALWDKVEDDAVGLYRQQIESTTDAFGLSMEKLKVYSRNLCILHTHAFNSSESEYLEFEELPSSWMPFIEAGLIRTFNQNDKWKLYPPNRFLIKIFTRYVKWFSWENVRRLVGAIHTSITTQTNKGNVFEYLFALELCSQSDCLLWKKLRSDLKLQPKLDWNHSICPIAVITKNLDQNKVNIMVDPDRSKSNTEVIFFAPKLNSQEDVRLNSQEDVRVLCQATTQVANSTTKSMKSFMSMFPLQADIHDYRLFLASRSSVDFSSVHEEQLSGANCFWFDSAQVASMLHFPQDICDPTKTEDSLEQLMNFAISHDEPEVASNIARFLSGASLKRKREEGFMTMTEFYEVLQKDQGLNRVDIDLIKSIFGKEDIKIAQLLTLTDDDLEKAGIKQLGLRKAILAVLGN
ncbi:hypothetical protein MP638_003113 [Amoeboaphelidium occidentale]|nr:hypothetical protein MP638_003113 [Amoeboaphelidium occidentale]